MSSVDPSVANHRQRLRQRWQEHQLDGFHDYEIIELLLTYAIPRIDVKPVAKRLIKRFGTLAGVFDASVNELQQEQGVGDKVASFLHLIQAVQRAYLTSSLPEIVVFDQPDRVRDYLRILLQGRSMECFGAIFTDHGHHPLAGEILFEGTVDRAAVYPRNLLKRALELDAKAMVLFHNHPARTPRASDADRALTQQIIAAGTPLDIRVLDHFIVAGEQVVSLKEMGLL
ncbi:MAG: DNA repair protein RadC [Mariprofundales bacterium]|nr:DNA repair protein RadC [Mariprofundales bacterium]